jgi:hypothetical protein
MWSGESRNGFFRPSESEAAAARDNAMHFFRTCFRTCASAAFGVL